jgi:hypothetical protein
MNRSGCFGGEKNFVMLNVERSAPVATGSTKLSVNLSFLISWASNVFMTKKHNRCFVGWFAGRTWKNHKNWYT